MDRDLVDRVVVLTGAPSGIGRAGAASPPHRRKAAMSRVRNLRVRPDLLYVASGWSTLVTDVHGRITGAEPQGFFARNTRVLSAERITVDGREPIAVQHRQRQAHAQLSYAELGDGETLPSRAAYLLMERFVGEGLRTRLTIVSYAASPAENASCACSSPPTSRTPARPRPVAAGSAATSTRSGAPTLGSCA